MSASRLLAFVGSARRVALRFAVLAAALGSAASLAANEAQAQDRYAIVTVRNVTDIPLNFEYRFAGGPWQAAHVAPGEHYYVYAAFTYPGSYRHDRIELRWDSDLRYGQDYYRTLVPYVRYSPSVDAYAGQWYSFDYDGPDFVAMYRQ